VKKKKEFEKIFSSGKILYSSDLLIKALFLIQPNLKDNGVKIAAAISSKAGKAVWRNRVKRLIKEAYRLNKKLILKNAKEKNLEILIVFSPNKFNENKFAKIKISEISPGIVELIGKISQQI
jgi:ribonuclease P protein component